MAATAGSSPCGRVEMGPIVKLAVGKSTLLRPKAPVTRILLGNPDHSQAARPTEGPLAEVAQAAGSGQQNSRRPGVADVDVLLLSPSEIYLLGKTVGSTNIVLLDRTGQCTVVDVAVGMDTAALTASLRELLPRESGIKVSSAADSLILSGMVSDASAADRAIDLATAYVRRGNSGGQGGRAGAHDQIINMLAVAAPQQVMLEVKVAEISKALLDQYGINFARAYSPADGSLIRFLSGVFGGKGLLGGNLSGTVDGSVGAGVVGSLSNGGYTSGNTAPSGSASVGGDSTTIPIARGKNSTMFSSDAQKQDGLVKVLAEPTVMAISGQEGSFLAGGRVFLPIASNSGNGGTSITLEEKEFGVSLKFTPTVLGDGRINLKVHPEVSELSAQGVAITATNVSGTAILPSFTTRRASTTVQLMDGQSFAIGGLIKNNVTANISAFPFLGEIPVLGALFRSTSFQNDRSELVFVITPRLVKPLPANYALPTDGFVEPSRSDMILNGRLEGKPRETPAPDRAPTQAPADANPAAPARGGFELK
ncbi:MAG: type II and III secretion system protein family protein [Rhodocyclaceae bacterium]